MENLYPVHDGALTDEMPSIEPPMPIGDASLVIKKLLEWDKKNVEIAKIVTLPILQECENDNVVYEALPKVGQKAAEEQENDVQTPECANQSDVVRAEYHRAMLEGSESGFRGVACPQEEQGKVDTSVAVIRDMLHEYGCEEELDDFLFDFLNQPYGGLKVVCHYKDEVVGALEEVPADDYSVMQAIGGYEDQGKPYQPVMVGQDSIVFETPEIKARKDFAYKAIDTRNLYFTNRMVKNIDDVPSIHEHHVWTLEQLEDGNFDLTQLGSPDANNVAVVEGSPSAGKSPLGSGQESNPNFPQYHVWESWSSIPWKAWIGKDFGMHDFIAFCDQFKISPNEKDVPQKWRRFMASGALLGVSPTYLVKKTTYPYRIDSFVKRRRELVARSYLSRVKEWEHVMHAACAMGMDNMRAKIYMSALLDDLAGMDEAKFMSLFQRKGLLKVEKGSRSWDDMIKFVGEMIPDMTPAAMGMIGLAKSNLQTYGSPAILMGQGDSETATQDMVNAQKGGQKITAPLRRAIFNVYVPIIEMIRDCMHVNFDGERWITEQGERGVPLAREARPVTRDDITSRYRIIPTATFDFVDRPVKAQQLIAILNIAAPVLTGAIPPSPPFFRLLTAVMEYQGIPREIIDAITDNDGRGTDPEEELAVMEVSKYKYIHVRPDDDHALCLMLLDQKITELNMQMPGAGDMFAAQDNVKRWFRDHKYHFDLQQFQMEQAAMMAEMESGGKGGGLKGPPMQPNPNPPTNAISSTRQVGQQNSPADKTNAPGMTGRGGMNAMAGGKTQQLLTQGGDYVQ